jgi:hypothetical protein
MKTLKTTIRPTLANQDLLIIWILNESFTGAEIFD